MLTRARTWALLALIAGGLLAWLALSPPSAGRARDGRARPQAHVAAPAPAKTPGSAGVADAAGGGDERIDASLEGRGSVPEGAHVGPEAPVRRGIAVRALTPAGEPLADALPPAAVLVPGRPEVRVTSEPAGAPLVRVGRWLWEARAAGELRPPRAGDELLPGTLGFLWLERPPPVFASLVLGQTLLECRRVTGSEEELVFLVDPDMVAGLHGSLAFRAVDAETGEPCAGESGGFTLVEVDEGGPRGLLPLDGDGRGRLDAVPAGDYALCLQLAGRAHVSLPFRLLPGANDLGDVPVPAAALLVGRVVDEAGEPVELTPTVRVPGDPRPSCAVAGDTGGERGAFVLGGLPRGRLLLYAVGEDWALEPTAVDASAPLVRDLVLVVRPGTPVTLVLPEAGGPIGWELRDGCDALVWWASSPPGAAERLTLPPGTFVLRLSLPGGEVREDLFAVGTTPVTVAAGE